MAERPKERSVLEQRPDYLDAIKPQTLNEAMDDNLKIVKDWKVKNVPAIFFADSQGRPLACFEGGSISEFREKLDSVLGR